ncbi:ABC transporter permease subunit, partial [Pseudomonas sp. 2822-17]|uniref:ABC transporter permease subunit n=1 Tax=Pseudomonas sp. 2822-17 TaxID=1712678 RepID=UPI00117ABD36
MDAMPVLMRGLWVTIQITVFSLLIAVVIGLTLGLFSIARNWLLKAIANTYVNIIRGTPILVQMLYIYIGLP